MNNEEAFEKLFPKPKKYSNYYEQQKLFEEWRSRFEGWQAAIAFMQEQNKSTEQSEPFGIWHVADDPDECEFYLYEVSGDVACENCIKLYTTPQRQQPLKRVSNERVMEIYNSMGDAYITDQANAIMDEMIRINK